MNPSNEPGETTVRFEQFVVFVLDEEEYAVPILAVTEVVHSIEITPVPGAPAYILGLTNLRGKVLPVLDLEKKFQFTRTTEVVRQHIMIAESEQKLLFGVLVDRVREVLKIPHGAIKPTPDMVKSNISAEYLGGVILLENPATEEKQESVRTLLILDLKKILSDTNIQELHAAADQQAPTNEGG
jgi:purine-binding chemotaxis protein CheW